MRWVVLMMVACSGDSGGSGDDDDDSSCVAEPGVWAIHYELVSGEDRFCPEIEDSTTDEIGGSVSLFAADCDQGCDCTDDPLTAPDCAGGSSQHCANGGNENTVTCVFDLTSSTSLDGSCDMTVVTPQISLECAYVFSARLQ